MIVLLDENDNKVMQTFNTTWAFGSVAVDDPDSDQLNAKKIICSLNNGLPTMTMTESLVKGSRRLKIGMPGDRKVPTPYEALYHNVNRGRLLTIRKSAYGVHRSSEGSYCLPPGTVIYRREAPHIFTNVYGPNVTVNSVTNRVTVTNSTGDRVRALERMYENAKANKIQLGETLAELQKSVVTIQTLAMSIANGYYHMRRGNFREALSEIFPYISKSNRRRSDAKSRGKGMTPDDKRYLAKFRGRKRKTFARQWLAYHYGIMPIVKDIDSAHKIYLLGLTNHPSLEFNSKGKSSTTKRYKTGSTLIEDRTSTFRYEVGATWQITDVSKFLGGQIGFTPADVPRLLWALVPGSFIFDWLVNIDGFLSSLSFLRSGVRYLHGYETASVRHLRQFSQLEVLSISYWNQTTHGNSWSLTNAMQRKVSSLQPFPLVEIKNPLSINHAVTLAALMINGKPKGFQQR